MKISFESIKISIAGAKLSHLVQKNRAWDHGCMTEQARIMFYLVNKAKTNGNIESLKKYVTASCFEKLEKNINELEKNSTVWRIENPSVTELAVIDVSPGKINKPDMFTAIIKGHSSKNDELPGKTDERNKFTMHWSFVRQGEWWMLDK